MKTSLISKLLCVLFTVSGTILFLVFGVFLIIFIYEIDSKEFINFNIPTISKNEFFNFNSLDFLRNLKLEYSINFKIILKILFNSSMLMLFWLQHIIMSNKHFKIFMEKYVAYHTFERGLYNLSKF